MSASGLKATFVLTTHHVAQVPRQELAVATIVWLSGQLFLPGHLPEVGGRARVGHPEILGVPDTSLDEGRLPDYCSCYSQRRTLSP
jgi:hypothetical protein